MRSNKTIIIFYGPGRIATIKLWLRRTLQLINLYATYYY